jgi:hypothetical protein
MENEVQKQSIPQKLNNKIPFSKAVYYIVSTVIIAAGMAAALISLNYGML